MIFLDFLSLSNNKIEKKTNLQNIGKVERIRTEIRKRWTDSWVFKNFWNETMLINSVIWQYRCSRCFLKIIIVPLQMKILLKCILNIWSECEREIEKAWNVENARFIAEVKNLWRYFNNFFNFITQPNNNILCYNARKEQ